MIYPYRCFKCEKEYEIVKDHTECRKEEHCPECGVIMDRVWTSFQIVGAKVETPEWNPGLGCVVKNKKHRAEVARQKGLIEIGNESVQHVEKASKRVEKDYD